jgi:excisionase family DNA binding protein/PAS domain S-box-containing protein
MILKEILTIREVATYLKIDRTTVWRWCKLRRIKAFKTGRSWRIHRSVAEALIREQNGEPMPPQHELITIKHYLSQLNELPQSVNLSVGEFLFEEGDIGREAYVIEEGQVEILKATAKGEQLLAVRQVGEIIGELALLDQSPRMATVRALTSCRLLIVTSRQFNQLLENASPVARTLLSTIVKRWRYTNDIVLNQSEELFRQVIASISDCIYVTKLDEYGNWETLFHSPNIEELCGYPTRMFMEDWHLWLAMVHPDDLEILTNQTDCLANGHDSEVEYRVIRANKKVVWVRDSARVKNEGNIRIVYGVISNITEHRRILGEKDRLIKAVQKQRERLSALTGQLAESQETEQKHLAQELHDSVGQNLSVLDLNINIVKQQLLSDSPEMQVVSTRLDASLAIVEQTGDFIRNIMANLRAPMLDDYGLIATLKWYGTQLADLAGFALIVPDEELSPRLPGPVENALFRIAQEVLVNTTKHAQATEVIITIEENDNVICLTITDNGIGFDSNELIESAELRGWGLLTITERAEAMGGHCEIESTPGEGTRVVVTVSRS